MATAAEIVRTRLLACAPVTALVSTRVYNVRFPQAPTQPSIRVNVVSDRESFHLRGPTDLHVARVQVDCIAPTRAAVNAVALAVHGDGLGADATGLSGFVGSVGGVTVNAIFADQPREYFDADELKQEVSSRDYFVHYRQAV